jgi:hypothetical protein
MQADVLLGRLKQLCHVLLRQPDCLTLKAHIDLQLPVLRLVNEELSALRWCLGIFAHEMILLINRALKSCLIAARASS